MDTTKHIPFRCGAAPAAADKGTGDSGSWGLQHRCSVVAAPGPDHGWGTAQWVSAGPIRIPIDRMAVASVAMAGPSGEGLLGVSPTLLTVVRPGPGGSTPRSGRRGCPGS